MLLVSGLVTGGLWFYRGLLADQIAGYTDALKKVESEFEPSLIAELRHTAQAIDVGRDLLGKHVALSQLFKFIEDNSLSDTRFSRFSYKDGSAILSGSTRSYAALAQQALIFEQSKFIRKATFSDFALGQGGFINFRVELVVDPSLIAYRGE